MTGDEVNRIHCHSGEHMRAGITPAELLARRRNLGMTQAQLGVVLGIRSNTVARWERGELPIGSPMLLRLALERLAVTPSPVQWVEPAAGSLAPPRVDWRPSLGELPHLPG